MKKYLLTLGIVTVLGLGIFGMMNMLVSADTTQIEAELGGYDNIFKLSEVHIGKNIINIYDLEKLGEDEIKKEFNNIGVELIKDTEIQHNIYKLEYNGETVGDVLINDYVTSINLEGDKIKVLGGIGLSGDTCKKELEYILKYKEDDESTWYGKLNNGGTSYDWCIDIGDETEDKALGFIYNENELQIDEYRVRFGFDKDGNVVGLQFNMFHGDGIEAV